ncbi:hypothetical protein F4861DRAFT_379503 [Xylaria intraflava]|nr:hypothetical protein F4861DRAFT_379503 [Xylaria intraflava]
MANSEKLAPSASRLENRTQSGHQQAKSATSPRKIPLHQIYALPAPIRTFPLPTFYPNNPLSLFHVIWAWTSQVLFPPPVEPSIIHQGYWSRETRSVHVRDPKSIRALWEQGFFGKGSYSRSEPNWLKREQSRQGQGDKKVSELITVQRREERKMMKWDRARKEQEAILKTRLQEAWVAPVGPMELLALPNSLQDLQLSPLSSLSNGHPAPGDSADFVPTGQTGGRTPPTSIPIPSTPRPDANDDHASSDVTEPTLKRKKSVRFSPEVKSTTFQLFDPPSPHPGPCANGNVPNGVLTNGAPLPLPVDPVPTELSGISPATSNSAAPAEIVDREHLQLSPEEAFYLVFGLGALSVTDPATGKPMASRELFELFRQLSHMSPRSAELRPDDPFLIQYAVYHHFRSLGWVPRSGIKFGVDWLLYLGGPVFSHAEFAVVVLPAYTDPYWKSQGQRPPERSWHWLHSINRVQSHALKTLVLVYVDIPPPTQASEPSALLKRYKIREFFMKRWLSNRSRS